jgi:hypothetical protein
VIDMKRKLLITFLLCCGASASAWAAPAGQVTHLSGILSVKKTDGTAKILSVKSEVDEGDTVTTEAETYARIKFTDGAEVVLRPSSQLKVESYRFDTAKPQSDNILLSMFKGGLRAVTGLVGQRSKDKVAYQTPTATIGIRGTHWGMLHCQADCGSVQTPTGQPPADGLHLDVASGAISVSNAAGTFVFDAGQFGYVPNANTIPQLVPGERGIRVTMPGSVAANKGSGDGIGKGSASECGVD